MRKICSGLLAAVLALGLLAAQPAQAKVYKMTQEERTAALKEKKQKRSKAKKAGKPAPGQDQGGWVEVKPGERPARKSKKASVDELAKAAENKGKKGKKAEAGKPAKPAKAAKPEKPEKSDKQAKAEKKAVAQPSDSIVVEKKGRKATAEAPEKAAATGKQAGAKSGRKAASKGDRLVGSNYTGERKVQASSTEVRRSGEELNSLSVSRPAPHTPAAAPAEKPAAAPELRHEVQGGPLDAAKPLGTEQKAGEGRF